MVSSTAQAKEEAPAMPYRTAQKKGKTTAMPSSVPRLLARDGESFTRADLKRVETDEWLNDTCIDTYVASLVLPSLQQPSSVAVEYWSRRELCSSAPNAQQIGSWFAGVTQDDLTLSMIYRPEPDLPLSAPKAPIIDLTEDEPLRWATTISHHKGHWTMMAVRFPLDLDGDLTTEVLVCDSMSYNITWHKSSLSQLAIRIARVLGWRVASARHGHADDADPEATGKDKAIVKGNASAAVVKPATVDITINCRMAKACPRQEDSHSCEPIACALLARFHHSPESVWDRLSSVATLPSITGAEARDHVKLHLAQHLTVLESVTRLREWQKQAFSLDIQAEALKDTPADAMADGPAPQDVKAFILDRRRRHKAIDSATTREREREDFITKRQRLHGGMALVGQLSRELSDDKE